MKKIPFLLSLTLIFALSCENKKTEEQGSADSVKTDTTKTDSTATEPVPTVSLQETWATDTTLQTPESVLFDPTDSTLYVSNIAGEPNKKDKNGFISKIGLDGKITTLKWATSLDAPKGMGILGGKLYVTDIDRLVEIDKKTGKTTKTFKVPGAKFLNDIIEDTASKTIYFSDTEDNKIYTFQNGKVSPFLDSTLGGPNGMTLVNGKLYLASFGDKTFKEIDLASKTSKTIVTEIGAGDGVEPTGTENEFIVSDWEGEVFLVSGENKKTSILKTKDQQINSADIEYIKEQNLLLVPTFFKNRVVAYKLNK